MTFFQIIKLNLDLYIIQFAEHNFRGLVKWVDT